ncbi:L-selectin-like [Glandiceps talaboti]
MMEIKLKLVFAFLCALSYTSAMNNWPCNGYSETYQGSCKLKLDPGCDCVIYHFYCEQVENCRPYCYNANAMCNYFHHGLAILDTQQKDQAVVSYIQSKGWDENSCIPHFGFWIGLNDLKVEDHFVWSYQNVRQGLCEEDYEHWAPGEPNNNPKRDPNGQDCVQLWFKSKKNGRWDDEYVDFRPKGAVCETRVPHCDYEECDINDDAIPNCVPSG